jgi:hypothetical protein
MYRYAHTKCTCTKMVIRRYIVWLELQYELNLSIYMYRYTHTKCTCTKMVIRRYIVWLELQYELNLSIYMYRYTHTKCTCTKMVIRRCNSKKGGKYNGQKNKQWPGYTEN